jgi:hypothetical protein
MLRFQSIKDDFIFDEALINIMRFWSSSFVKLAADSKEYQRPIDIFKNEVLTNQLIQPGALKFL